MKLTISILAGLLTLSGLVLSFIYLPGIFTYSDAFETQSNLIENDGTWKIEKTLNKGNEKIYRHHFLRGNIIYALGYDNFVSSLHKSTDSGKTWSKIYTFSNYGVNDLVFLNSNQGFAALSVIKSEDKKEAKSYLMKTEDGGINWQPIYSSTEIDFHKFALKADGVGILIGSKGTSDQGLMLEDELLLTRDFGKAWIKISDTLTTQLKTSIGQESIHLTDVYFTDDKKISLLTVKGHVVSTSDYGDSWSLVHEMKNEPEQTAFSILGKSKKGKVWVVGGTMSTEGIWAVIAVPSNRFSWKKHRLNNYYLNDVEFLSETEILASGTKFHNEPITANKANMSVILFSIDGGASWATIYESQKVESKQFAEISVIDKNRVLIDAGSEGIIALTR